MQKNEDPNKQLPSLAQVFERTRQRDEKKKYADTYEDTASKIVSLSSILTVLKAVNGDVDAYVSEFAPSMLGYTDFL